MSATFAVPVVVLSLFAGEPGDPKTVNAQTRELTKIYEDIEVLQALLQHTLTEVYGEPSVVFSAEGKPRAVGTVEGVYLPGQGVLCTATLSAPPYNLLPGKTASSKALSAWEQKQLELRGEKP